MSPSRHRLLGWCRWSQGWDLRRRRRGERGKKVEVLNNEQRIGHPSLLIGRSGETAALSARIERQRSARDSSVLFFFWPCPGAAGRTKVNRSQPSEEAGERLVGENVVSACAARLWEEHRHARALASSCRRSLMSWLPPPRFVAAGATPQAEPGLAHRPTSSPSCQAGSRRRSTWAPLTLCCQGTPACASSSERAVALHSQKRDPPGGGTMLPWAPNSACRAAAAFFFPPHRLRPGESAVDGVDDCPRGKGPERDERVTADRHGAGAHAHGHREERVAGRGPVKHRRSLRHPEKKRG